jgi:phosphoenolpyruvate carboxylase
MRTIVSHSDAASSFGMSAVTLIRNALFQVMWGLTDERRCRAVLVLGEFYDNWRGVLDVASAVGVYLSVR